MRNVVRLDRPFDDPFPPDVRDLDQVWIVLFYHDTVWMGVDRDRMNRRVFEALRPGGVYAIIDHSGRPGTGTGEAESLHRIEESVVRAEVKRAGFRIDASTDVLRNPNDPRDWNPSPRAAGDRRGTSDRFVLRFVKPAAATVPPAATSP
jgi:predicted methyltransferase